MGMRRALMPVAAMVLMSSSVKKVSQCVFRAVAELGMESNVNWSTAEENDPEKQSAFIHFSRTSQPPRLTPRRKGISAGPWGEIAAGLGRGVEMMGGRFTIGAMLFVV